MRFWGPDDEGWPPAAGMCPRVQYIYGPNWEAPLLCPTSSLLPSEFLHDSSLKSIRLADGSFPVPRTVHRICKCREAVDQHFLRTN